MKREDIMLLLSHRKVQRLYCVICCCENRSAWPERSCTFIFANTRCLSNCLIYWFKKKMLTVLKHLASYLIHIRSLSLSLSLSLNLNLEQTWAIIIVMLLLAINTKWKLWMQSIMLLSRLQEKGVQRETSHRHHCKLCQSQHDSWGQSGGDQRSGLHLQSEVLLGAQGGDRCVEAPACPKQNLNSLKTMTRSLMFLKYKWQNKSWYIISISV